jgi:glycosyltransferase involved in cell wall biosynthesis
MKKKYKVLLWSDSPTAKTGFGNVISNILKGMLKEEKYIVDAVGVNCPAITEPPTDYTLFPAMTEYTVRTYGPNFDVIGQRMFIEKITDNDYDMVFILQDSFNLAPIIQELLILQTRKKFKTVFYYPVDGVFLKEWCQRLVSPMNFPVAFTEYGKTETLKFCPELENVLTVIPHGVDLEKFKVIDEKTRIKLRESAIHFKTNDSDTIIDLTDKFVYLNVNRFFSRKDFPSTLKAFSLVLKERPNSYLITVCQNSDHGGVMTELASTLGLEYGKQWFIPLDYALGKGYSTEELNLIYNLSDCVVSSTLGEGVGLSSLEGQAVKKPCVFPDHTSLSEIFDYGKRGYLVPAGKDLDHFRFMGHECFNKFRPSVSVYDMAKAMIEAQDNKELSLEKAELGYKWAQENLDWQHIYDTQWKPLFDKVLTETT